MHKSRFVATPVRTFVLFFLLSLVLSQAHAQLKTPVDPRLPIGAKIDGEGKVILKKSSPLRPMAGRIENRNFAALADGGRPDNPQPSYTVPPPPPPVSLSVDDVAKTLSDLFQWNPAAGKYGTYFLLLPGEITIKQNVAADVAIDPTKTFAYKPYQLTGIDVAIKVNQIHDLLGVNAFKVDHQGDPNDADFVVLDGFNQKVPIKVASIIESNFINGLVTRLILGDFARAWKMNPKDFSLNNFAATPTWADMTQTNLYPADKTFDYSVGQILQNNPVQPAGLFWGWKAGDDLDALVGGNAKYKADVWKLIKARFSDRDMGRMIGYALSQNVTMGDGAKKDSLARLASFLDGFETGSIQAADQIYVDVFALAYGIGYQDGFKDGYAQGYAAGYKVGYDAGYAQAWKEANVVIGRLQQQLQSSGGDFWSTVGAIAGIAGTVLSFL